MLGWIENFKSLFAGIIVGYLVSRLTPTPDNNLAGLTIFSNKAKPVLPEAVEQAV